MPSLFAQNLLVQTWPSHIVLSFFETVLPPKGKLTEAEREQLEEIGILAECVARITMTPDAFVEAARVMSEMAENIKKASGGQEERNAKS